MKTNNWQTKALNLFIAGIALFLTTACQSENADEYPLNPHEFSLLEFRAPSTPCGKNVSLTQSIEFAQLKDANFGERYTAERARRDRLRPEENRIREILGEYEELIQMQQIDQGGHIDHYGVVSIWNKDGQITDKYVIGIIVIEDVRQTMLPLEKRIPECMDGVPVHYILLPPVTTLPLMIIK